MRDEAEQARYVVERVLDAPRGRRWRSRRRRCCSAPRITAAPLEVELTRRNIPFVKFGGLKFLEAAHVKDVLAFLRFAENPRDRVAGFRVIQLLPGVGPATAARVLDAMAAADPLAAMAAFKPPAGGRGSCGRPSSRRPPAARPRRRLAGRARARAALVRAASRAHARGRRRCARPISPSSRRSPPGYPSRERFLTELTLDPPDATSDEAGVPLLDEDYLILSTIHSAKGQEWKSVFVLNVVDGCIPSDLATGTSAEIEEERRLLYVAMTRAKDQLDLIVPQRFFAHQQTRQRRPPHVRVAHALHSGGDPAPFRMRHVAQGPAGPGPRGSIYRAPVDIGAKLRRMWG